MKLIYALLGALLLACTPAYAADVSIPWGDWLSAAMTFFREDIIYVLSLAVVWAGRKIPGQLGELIQGLRLNALLERAADYSIAAVNGAAKGKTIDIKIANEMIGAAVQYALANAPALASKYADTLHAKLLARIGAKVDLSPEVSAPALSVTLPTP